MSASVFLLGSAYGYKYEIEVDGEMFEIESDSVEVSEQFSSIGDTGHDSEHEEKITGYDQHNAVLSNIEQIPSISAKEELRKLESMVYNLKSDLDNFEPRKQSEEEIPEEVLKEELRDLERMVSSIEENMDAFKSRKDQEINV